MKRKRPLKGRQPSKRLQSKRDALAPKVTTITKKIPEVQQPKKRKRITKIENIPNTIKVFANWEEEDKNFIDDTEILENIKENIEYFETEEEAELIAKQLEKEFLEERSFWSDEDLNSLFFSLEKHGRHFLHAVANEMEIRGSEKSYVEIECYLKSIEKLKQFCAVESLQKAKQDMEKKRKEMQTQQQQQQMQPSQPNPQENELEEELFNVRESVLANESQLNRERKIAARELSEENLIITQGMKKIAKERREMNESQKMIENEMEEQEVIHKRYVSMYLEQKGCQLHPTTFDLIGGCLQRFVRELIERADIYRMERQSNLITSHTSVENQELWKQMDSDDVMMALHDLDRNSPSTKNNIHLRKL